jgi:hypothetical protein
MAPGKTMWTRKEYTKYNLTAAAQAHGNDWSRWFAISSPPPI